MMSLPLTTAVALILGFAALASGALMYWLRGGMRGGAPPSRRYLVWERSFIMGAVVLTAVGLVLLADLLAASDGAAMARAGAAAYIFGGVLVVAAEASSLAQGLHQDWPAQPRFKGSSQHCLVKGSVEALRGLRREFSSRGFFGVGC